MVVVVVLVAAAAAVSLLCSAASIISILYAEMWIPHVVLVVLTGCHGILVTPSTPSRDFPMSMSMRNHVDVDVDVVALYGHACRNEEWGKWGTCGQRIRCWREDKLVCCWNECAPKQ